MIKDKVSINIISSFNHTNFIGLLENNNDFKWQINDSNYNQIFQILSDRKLNIWKKKSDISLIWSTPESISPEFKKLLNHEKANKNTIKKDIDFFFNCLRTVKKNSDIILIPNWILREPNESSIALSFSKKLGIEYHLSYMNYYLSELMNKEKNFYLLNSTKWLTNCGSEATYNSKLWYLMKSPFSNEFYNEAILDVVSIFKTLKGLSKKLLVLDLDNTLWGGVVGENGWEGITLGGHDFKGEAFVDFQRNLKRFSLRGIQLAIISKNDESVALDAIKNHPEMVLNIEDFIGWRINWNDKAENLLDLVKEINIGLDSVVFLDDNPAERDRVRNAFTEVLVPDLPEDATLYSSLLNSLDCFNTSSITEEDKNRTAMYVSQMQRNKSISVNSSKKEWLQNLDTSLKVEKINKVNINRITQLFNKTNQLNLSTRRLSQSEILDFASKKNNEIISITLSDSFGQMGLVGIMGIQIDGINGIIKDFILSCRAMGRGVEKAMLYIAGLELKKMWADVIYAEYIKTERNGPTLKVLEDINLIKKNNIFYMPDKIENLRENHIELDSNL